MVVVAGWLFWLLDLSTRPWPRHVMGGGVVVLGLVGWLVNRLVDNDDHHAFQIQNTHTHILSHTRPQNPINQVRWNKMRDVFSDVHLLVLTLLLNWVVGTFPPPFFALFCCLFVPFKLVPLPLFPL